MTRMISHMYCVLSVWLLFVSRIYVMGRVIRFSNLKTGTHLAGKKILSLFQCGVVKLFVNDFRRGAAGEWRGNLY